MRRLSQGVRRREQTAHAVVKHRCHLTKRVADTDQISGIVAELRWRILQRILDGRGATLVGIGKRSCMLQRIDNRS